MIFTDVFRKLFLVVGFSTVVKLSDWYYLLVVLIQVHLVTFVNPPPHTSSLTYKTPFVARFDRQYFPRSMCRTKPYVRTVVGKTVADSGGGFGRPSG